MGLSDQLDLDVCADSIRQSLFKAPALLELFNALLKQYRENILEPDSQGLSKQDLAKKLNIKVDSVKVNASRLRDRLKELNLGMVLEEATDPSTREYRLKWIACLKAESSSGGVPAQEASTFFRPHRILALSLTAVAIAALISLGWFGFIHDRPLTPPAQKDGPIGTSQSTLDSRSPFTIRLWRLRATPANTKAEKELSFKPNRPPVVRYPVQMKTVDVSTVETDIMVGDRVQLDLRGDVEGYVYVFNREMYKDKVGPATLAFPGPGQPNRIKPGQQLAVPANDSSGDYFSIQPDDASNLVEDQLIFVVSESILPDSVLAGGEAFAKLCSQYLQSSIDTISDGSLTVSTHPSERRSIHMLEVRVRLKSHTKLR